MNAVIVIPPRRYQTAEMPADQQFQLPRGTVLELTEEQYAYGVGALRFLVEWIDWDKAHLYGFAETWVLGAQLDTRGQVVQDRQVRIPITTLRAAIPA